MRYTEYLKTDHWQELKKEKRSKTKKRCGICGDSQNVDTHHLNYKGLFDVDTTDLRFLCRRCHFLAHDLMDAGVIKFRNTNHHSRWAIMKHQVVKVLKGNGSKRKVWNPR